MQLYCDFVTMQARRFGTSLLCRLILRPSATATGDFMPNQDALNAIRSWIAVGMASTPALGDDLTTGIPDDFVKQRQADSKVRFKTF